MSPQNEQSAGAGREQGRARLRTLTRVALLATTGATVGIGIVIAHEHPGSSGATAKGGSSGSSGTTASSGSTGSTGTTGSTGNTGSSSTGNTGSSSSAPSSSSSRPSVTSGGTSR
jgi:hypothetical protein